MKHIAVNEETLKSFNELKKSEGMTADGLLKKLIEKFKEEKNVR